MRVCILCVTGQVNEGGILLEWTSHNDTLTPVKSLSVTSDDQTNIAEWRLRTHEGSNCYFYFKSVPFVRDFLIKYGPIYHMLSNYTFTALNLHINNSRNNQNCHQNH